MATKNFQFFINLEQLVNLLVGIVSKLDLWLILYRRGKQSELVLLDSIEDTPIDRISSYDCVFIATTRPDISGIDVGALSPAKHGWLQLDLPKENGETLYLSDLAVKTDWYEVDDNKIHENRGLEKIYNKVKKEIRANLSSPVFAINTKTGRSATYKDMAYASSAKKWEENGGELKQFGVENVKFSTKPIA